MGPPGSQTGEEALRGTGRGKRLLAAVAVALVGIALFPAVAQLAAPPLLRLVLGTAPAPLTQAPALPELSRGRSTELTT